MLDGVNDSNKRIHDHPLILKLADIAVRADDVVEGIVYGSSFGIRSCEVWKSHCFRLEMDSPPSTPRTPYLKLEEAGQREVKNWRQRLGVVGYFDAIPPIDMVYVGSLERNIEECRELAADKRAVFSPAGLIILLTAACPNWIHAHSFASGR